MFVNFDCNLGVYQIWRKFEGKVPFTAWNPRVRDSLCMNFVSPLIIMIIINTNASLSILYGVECRNTVMKILSPMAKLTQDCRPAGDYRLLAAAVFSSHSQRLTKSAYSIARL